MTPPAAPAPGDFSPGELLKQDSLGRVRTPREQRLATVDAFERGAMSAARFSRHHGIKYSTLCSWIAAARRRSQEPPSSDPPENPASPQSATPMRWLEAVVQCPHTPERSQPQTLSVEWRGARLRIETPEQARWAAILLRELEGAGC